MALYIYRKNAFTLIEVMIALVIFAIVGTLAALGLQHLIRVQNRLQAHERKFNALVNAVTLMRRDLMFVVTRAAVDDYGNTQKNVLTSGKFGDVSKLMFVRSGMLNPFSIDNRSDLSYVEYRYDPERHELDRYLWVHPDRALNSKPIQQVLLTDVLHWKAEAGSKAVVITMTLKHWGDLQIIEPLPQREVR